MKKKLLLLCLCVFLFTGCNKKLVCKSETTEELYKEQQKITFNFEDEKVKEVMVDYIMIFSDEETAKSYLTIFEALNKDYEISLDGNTINIKSFKNYEQYNQNKEELKEELENNGYICK